MMKTPGNVHFVGPCTVFLVRTFLSALLFAGAESAQAQPAVYTYQGSAASETLGTSVAGLGDINGDSVPDFVIGSPGATTANGSQSGKAVVYSGATGSALYTYNGSSAGAQFGYSALSLGDITGDHVSDFAIGATGSTQAGYVKIYSGANGAVVRTLTQSSPGAANYGNGAFGFKLENAGDLDHDGIGDLAIGMPGYAPSTTSGALGKIFIYSGASGSVIRSFSGTSTRPLGVTIAGMGDLDSDGYPDFAFGIGSATSLYSFIDVFSGHTGSLIREFCPKGGTPPSGCTADGGIAAVTSVGDITGDGISDLAIGEPFGFLGDGTVQIRSGSSNSVIRTLAYTARFDKFGYTLSNAGDMDGDGIPDLLVGAPGPSGYATLFSGASGVSKFIRRTSSSNDQFGWAISMVGDVNSDSVQDVLIAANQFSGSFTNQGRAEIFSVKLVPVPPAADFWTPIQMLLSP